MWFGYEDMRASGLVLYLNQPLQGLELLCVIKICKCRGIIGK